MYIAIGKIVQAHGLQGYVKAIPYSGLPDRFMQLKTVYIETGEGMHGFIVEDVQPQARASLVKLKSIDTRDAAHSLVKNEIWVPEEQKIDLPDNVYYVHDLVGLKVFDIEGEYLGDLEEVLSNAGNDVYVVRKEHREVLIPAVSEFVKEVNLQQKRMTVQLIEGMLE